MASPVLHFKQKIATSEKFNKSFVNQSFEDFAYHREKTNNRLLKDVGPMRSGSALGTGMTTEVGLTFYQETRTR